MRESVIAVYNPLKDKYSSMIFYTVGLEPSVSAIQNR